MGISRQMLCLMSVLHSNMLCVNNVQMSMYRWGISCKIFASPRVPKSTAPPQSSRDLNISASYLTCTAQHGTQSLTAHYIYISVSPHQIIRRAPNSRPKDELRQASRHGGVRRMGNGGEQENWLMRRRKRRQRKVARWQNLIPSFLWIAPGWRAWAWGHNPRKGSDQLLQRSVAEP